jgi:hypothetical protein
MVEPKYDNLKIVGLHEPDSSLDTNADGVKERTPLPGMYVVGVELGGRFMEVARFKAGNIVDENNKVKVGGKAKASSDDSTEDSTDES